MIGLKFGSLGILLDLSGFYVLYILMTQPYSPSEMLWGFRMLNTLCHPETSDRSSADMLIDGTDGK